MSPAEFDWSQRRILVVDNDIEFLTWVETTLRGVGAGAVRSALSGKGILALLGKFAADVLIIDLKLDQMSGVDVIREIRAANDGPIANLPIILIAASPDVTALAEACALGIHNFIRKPVNAETFLKRISATVLNPRPLVVTRQYFGPDRRVTAGPYQGQERRKSAAPAPTAARAPVDRAAKGGEPAAAAAPANAAGAAADWLAELTDGKEGADISETHGGIQVRRILEDHKLWLRSRRKRGGRAALKNADLKGVRLSRANLAGADLTKANLSAATCQKTVFGEAAMQYANLAKADLAGADLAGAMLDHANLTGASLDGANLREADLTNADLTKASLVAATCRKAGFGAAEMREANLAKADFTGANLSIAVLRRADLTEACLDGANLRAADLAGADLHGASMKAADLKGAIVLTTDFRGVDLSTATGLTQEQLDKATTDEATRPPAGLQISPAKT